MALTRITAFVRRHRAPRTRVQPHGHEQRSACPAVADGVRQPRWLGSDVVSKARAVDSSQRGLIVDHSSRNDGASEKSKSGSMSVTWSSSMNSGVSLETAKATTSSNPRRSRIRPRRNFSSPRMRKLQRNLAADLLERIGSNSPTTFDRWSSTCSSRWATAEAFSQCGQVIGRCGDGGIDGIIRQAILGLDAVRIKPSDGGEPWLARPCESCGKLRWPQCGQGGAHRDVELLPGRSSLCRQDRQDDRPNRSGAARGAANRTRRWRQDGGHVPGKAAQSGLRH